MNSEQLLPFQQPPSAFQRFVSAVKRLIAQKIIEFILLTMVAIIYITPPELWGHNDSLVMLYEVGKFLAYTISVALVLRIADERELTSLGLERNIWALIDFAVGFLIMFLIVGAFFAVYIALGWIEIRQFAWQSQSNSTIFWSLVLSLLTFGLVGWSEELLSRGFYLQVISEGTNRFLGIVLSSFIFAYLHRNNPGITLPNLISIFTFGLVAAFAYYKTGQLWLAMGLHTGWDFCVVTVFYGTPIANLRLFHLMEYSSISIPDLLLFGIELISLLICTGAVQIYAKRRKSMIPLQP